MIDKNTLDKISKVDDKEIIKDILTANGYNDVKLMITEQKTDGIKSISINYKHNGKVVNTFLRREDHGFIETTADGKPVKTDEVAVKKFESNPISEPKGIIRTKTYVGDSTRLYGDEIDEEMGKDERGKPVRKSFMETHGQRIARLMWEIANQKADPHVKLSDEEQRRLEQKLDQDRKYRR